MKKVSLSINYQKFPVSRNHLYTSLFDNQIKIEHHNFLIIQNKIIKQNGNYTVNELANNLNQSRITIQRIFQDNIGTDTKDYIKTIRFKHTCILMTTVLEIDWFDIIFNCGYHDQMYFIHNFKMVIKYTPMKFLKISKGNFYFTRPIIIF